MTKKKKETSGERQRQWIFSKIKKLSIKRHKHLRLSHFYIKIRKKLYLKSLELMLKRWQERVRFRAKLGCQILIHVRLFMFCSSKTFQEDFSKWTVVCVKTSVRFQESMKPTPGNLLEV